MKIKLQTIHEGKVCPVYIFDLIYADMSNRISISVLDSWRTAFDKEVSFGMLKVCTSFSRILEGTDQTSAGERGY